MFTDEEQTIISDIIQWLNTEPTVEEIIYYIKRVPEKHWPLVDGATSLQVNTLDTEKEIYFRNNNCYLFLATVTVPEQMVLINLFTQFNATSVLKNTIKKYPELASQSLPTDLSIWSKSFISRFEALSYFAASKEYIGSSVYSGSLLDGFFTPEDLISLQDDFEKMLARLDNRFVSLENIATADIEEDRALFKKLPFLPGELIASLTNPNNLESEYDFVFRFVRLLILINQYGIAEARANHEKFLSFMFDYLSAEYIDKILVEFEARRLQEVIEDGDYQNIIQGIQKCWTKTALVNGEISKNIEELYGGLTESDKPLFTEFLYTFLRNYHAVIEVLYPYNPDMIIEKLKKVSDLASLSLAVEELSEEINDQEQLISFKQALNTIYYIVKNYPEPTNSATNV